MGNQNNNENKNEDKKAVSTKRVVVKFITGAYKAYVVGDIAGFNKKTADMLVEKEIAKKVK